VCTLQEEVSHLICTVHIIVSHLSSLYTAAPMIDPPSSSTVTVVAGSTLTLSCTSQGSPPDTFTMMKDNTPITPPPSITAVTHNEATAVFQIEYNISSVTISDRGTYMCTVTNPIGSDSETITVDVTGSYMFVYNTFTPQIKAIPEVKFAM